MESHYRKLERMYLGANVNRKIYPSTTIQIQEKRAEISLDVNPNYFHALNAMHGSVCFKLLDDAAFFAVNSIVKDKFVLTTSFSINLLRPVTTGILKAVGEVEFFSKNLFVAMARLYDQKGREVAFGTGNFVKSKVGLTEDIGYF